MRALVSLWRASRANSAASEVFHLDQHVPDRCPMVLLVEFLLGECKSVEVDDLLLDHGGAATCQTAGDRRAAGTAEQADHPSPPTMPPGPRATRPATMPAASTKPAGAAATTMYGAATSAARPAAIIAFRCQPFFAPCCARASRLGLEHGFRPTGWIPNVLRQMFERLVLDLSLVVDFVRCDDVAHARREENRGCVSGRKAALEEPTVVLQVAEATSDDPAGSRLRPSASPGRGRSDGGGHRGPSLLGRSAICD